MNVDNNNDNNNAASQTWSITVLLWGGRTPVPHFVLPKSFLNVIPGSKNVRPISAIFEGEKYCVRLTRKFYKLAS